MKTIEKRAKILLRLHQACVGFVEQHATCAGACRHQARIDHLQVRWLFLRRLCAAAEGNRDADGDVNDCSHSKEKYIFRLRASDADDDYPLKFSIQGKTNPYLIAQAAGSLQNSLSVQEQHKLT